jgi:hypothetical protein
MLAGTVLASLIGAGPAGAAHPGRNGAVAYHGKQSARGFLYVRDADGSDLRRIRTAAPPSDPAFSPLGRRIAFASGGQVWVMNADGSDPRRVTSGAARSRAPTWSPAGDRIAFALGPEGHRDLYVIGAAGRALRRVTFNRADEEAPDWSAGNRIVFVRHTRRGDGDIFVVRPKGGRPRRLTHGRRDDGEPTWSPDGRRIAFTRGSASRREVFVMRADGSHVRRLTRMPRGVTSPAWSPDGRRIAFGMGRRGRRALHVMRSDGRGARRVASGASDPRSIDWQPVGGDPIVAAAGDIACDPASKRFGGTRIECRHRQTSDLLLRMELSAVLMLGDAQYAQGTLSNFMLSFHPSWGRLKSLIRPAVGNHEYADPGAAGYFDYFNGAGRPDGPAGPRAAGHYSFDLGDWHVVALNSQCDVVACAAGSAQERWLRADLAAHPARCTLAFWHHPLMSSGIRGLNSSMQALWQALYDAGVDLALTGHDHAYERFAPIDPALNRDPARGIRQLVVGTGGRDHRAAIEPKPHSEVRNDDTFGILELRLRPNGYFWTFVPEGRGTFTDSGANACHGAPPSRRGGAR